MRQGPNGYSVLINITVIVVIITVAMVVVSGFVFGT